MSSFTMMTRWQRGGPAQRARQVDHAGCACVLARWDADAHPRRARFTGERGGRVTERSTHVLQGRRIALTWREEDEMRKKMANLGKTRPRRSYALVVPLLAVPRSSPRRRFPSLTKR